MTIYENITVSNGFNVEITEDQKAILLFLEALVGGGKTYSVAEHIKATPADRFIIFAKTGILARSIHQMLPDSELVLTSDMDGGLRGHPPF